MLACNFQLLLRRGGYLLVTLPKMTQAMSHNLGNISSQLAIALRAPLHRSLDERRKHRRVVSTLAVQCGRDGQQNACQTRRASVWEVVVIEFRWRLQAVSGK
jgi:hypothetical protein